MTNSENFNQKKKNTHCLSVNIFFTNILKAIGMHICGCNTPDPDGCGAKSLKSFAPFYRGGIPELGVASLDPMFLEEVTLADIPDFRTTARNVTILGFANFSLSNFKVNSKNQTFSGDLLFDNIILNAEDFHVLAKIIVPINERGRLESKTGSYHEFIAFIQQMFK